MTTSLWGEEGDEKEGEEVFVGWKKRKEKKKLTGMVAVKNNEVLEGRIFRGFFSAKKSSN